jgi:M6 family metalloprotease-like protein
MAMICEAVHRSFLGVPVFLIACGLSACGAGAGQPGDETLGATEQTLGTCGLQVLPIAAATASSAQNDGYFRAAWAIDRDLSTRWSSNTGSPQWLDLDLGQRRFVGAVSIDWERAYSTSFDIQVSDNKVNWAAVRSITSAQGGHQDITSIDLVARYVRIYSRAATSWGNVSINEVTVLGDASASCASVPQTCGQSVRLPVALAQASSAEFSYTPASAAVDGVYSTRWSSAWSDNQWIALDLGASVRVDGVRITWESAYGREYAIQSGTSMNGPWTTVRSIATGKGGVESVSGLAATTRYLRVLGVKRATGYGYSVWDIDVFGSAGCATPTIALPAPGAVLKKKTQTFSWIGTADEYWLRIGTSAGAADVFDSGSLGTALSTTVSGLPLTGAPLYAELKSRKAAAYSTSTAAYTAPVRVGLCVIADFADSTLEQWTGYGFKTESDVRAMLTSMAQHWTWASRGKEQTRWDLARVTLPQTLVANQFNDDGSAFRNAVVDLVKQKTSVADYDVNDDGNYDGIWIVASSKNHAEPGYEWLRGGTSAIAGAAVFVDGQGSDSVAAGAYGNFNHEFGHCLGLPDLYGTYGTIVDLSFMADSWPRPANDLCAYDRLKLGWLSPTVITQTTRNIVLRSANDAFEAVKIPTSRPSEYYLAEYRTRPTSGYGSSAQGYNGLAVYHVFEDSNQATNPPLLKVEPADGQITPDVLPQLSDLLSPGNPAAPFKVGTYFGTQTVFQIENVRWATGGIQFDVVVVNTTTPVPQNLLSGIDPGFELGTAGWTTDAWKQGASTFSWASIGNGGSGHSLSISSVTTDNDARWARTFSSLAAGQAYLFCGWLKGVNITPYAGATVGANLTVLNGPDYPSVGGGLGTYDFTKYCLTFQAKATSVDLWCRLGNFGSTVWGTGYCDDLSLSTIRPAF